MVRPRYREQVAVSRGAVRQVTVAVHQSQWQCTSLSGSAPVSVAVLSSRSVSTMATRSYIGSGAGMSRYRPSYFLRLVRGISGTLLILHTISRLLNLFIIFQSVNLFSYSFCRKTTACRLFINVYMPLFKQAKV